MNTAPMDSSEGMSSEEFKEKVVAQVAALEASGILSNDEFDQQPVEA
jgi:hypothetical protein